MTTVHRHLAATPHEVWDTLADGWLYPLFVVGASRMRDVDATWPAVGSEIHHSAGVWPLLVDDTTTVFLCEPLERLGLRASGRPGGEADVAFELRARPAAQGGGTDLWLSEDVVTGPARLVPKPVRAVAIAHRNTETLRRLAYVAERRTATGSAS